MTGQQDQIGRALMTLMAVIAILVFASSLLTLPDAPNETRIVEGWRTFGFATFAGIWLILALWPRRVPGLWELLIFHKAAVTALAFTAWNVTGSKEVAVVDLILVTLTLLAYILCRGWQAWRGITFKTPPPT